MATTRSKKQTTAIPTLRDIEKRVSRFRKDLEKTANRVTREAVRYIPKSSRRQFGDILERVNDLGDTVTKRVTKTVKGVRAEVEDTVDDLRGTVDKQVRSLSKDAKSTSQKAIETLEKETRKQVERFLAVIGVPSRSDVEIIRRRIDSIERKVSDLVADTMRKRSKSDESQAA